MNFVFLSPHFPPNYYRFAVALKDHGVNVLGLSDESYDSLRSELKASLTEYFRVDDMHNYDASCARSAISLTATANSTVSTRTMNTGWKRKPACARISISLEFEPTRSGRLSANP